MNSSPENTEKTEASNLIDDKKSSDEEICESKSVRWFSYIWGFLIGMDRSIIIPIMWLYLLNDWNKLVAQQYYGICSSGYNISAIFATICTTLVFQTDFKIISPKKSLILFNIFAIAGNIIYSLGIHPALILTGRLLTGLSSSGQIPLISDTIKTTKIDDRPTVFSYTNGLFVLGLSIGPSADLVVELIRRASASSLKNSTFSVYKAPGIIMATTHLIYLILFLIFYPGELKYPLKDEESFDESTENLTFWQKISHPHICNMKFFSIVFAEASIYFMFISLETSMGPIVEEHFHWVTLNTATIFFFYGIACIMSYVVIGALFKCFTDFTLFTAACVWKSCAAVACLVILLRLANNLESKIMLVTIWILQIPGDSLFLAPGDVIFSKIVPLKFSLLGQGILRIAIAIGVCLGTLFAGSISSGAYYWVVAVVITANTALVTLFFVLGFWDKCSKPDVR